MSAVGGSTLQRIKGRGNLSVINFDLSQLPTNQALGTVSANVELQIITLDSIKATISVLTDSLLLKSPEQNQPIQLSPLSINSSLLASTDELFQNIQLHQLLVKVNHFFSGEMDASLRLNQKMSVRGQIREMILDHAALLQWLPKEIKKPLEGFHINGKTRLTGDMNLDIQEADTSYSAAVQLVTSPTDLDFSFENLFIKNLQINSEAEIDSKSGGKLDFVLSIDSTLSTVTEPLTFLNNKIGLHVTMKDNFQYINVDTGYVSLPDLKTFGFIAGSVSDLVSNPQINAHMEFHQAAKDTLVVTKDIRFKGENDIVCFVGTNKNTAHLDARLQAKDLSFFLPNNTRISRINADISLSQKIDLQEMMLLGSSQPIVKTPSAGLIDYFLYRNYYTDHINKSRISIRRVEVGEYQVENISLEAYLGNGRIEIPSFLFDVYGGNIGGQLAIVAGMDNILDAEYKLSAHFSGINSALLLPAAKADEGGIITAHAEIQGRGIDVEQGIDIDGYFNITEIESKVADNLLRSLDPEGKDSGIRSTRILINRGFKPRLFQFEIRHSYCYPAVYFDQPWYFPVRLSGGGLELSRIPIAYFLNMNQTSSRSAE